MDRFYLKLTIKTQKITTNKYVGLPEEWSDGGPKERDGASSLALCFFYLVALSLDQIKEAHDPEHINKQKWRRKRKKERKRQFVILIQFVPQMFISSSQNMKALNILFALSHIFSETQRSLFAMNWVFIISQSINHSFSPIVLPFK